MEVILNKENSKNIEETIRERIETEKLDEIVVDINNVVFCANTTAMYSKRCSYTAGSILRLTFMDYHKCNLKDVDWKYELEHFGRRFFHLIITKISSLVDYTFDNFATSIINDKHVVLYHEKSNGSALPRLVSTNSIEKMIPVIRIHSITNIAPWYETNEI